MSLDETRQREGAISNMTIFVVEYCAYNTGKLRKIEEIDSGEIENALFSEEAEKRGIETGSYLDEFFEYHGRD